MELLTFSVLINLSLAVMNLPPLDGGRILFCVLEKITGLWSGPSLR
jgi:membrane-associated protease RseP (regulator of RpoE activity)